MSIIHFANYNKQLIRLRDNNYQDLYILTESYPFGNGEVFLNDEIEQLSQYFSNLYIVPRVSMGKARSFPSGIENIRILNNLLKFTKLEISFCLISNGFFVHKFPSYFYAQSRLGITSAFRSLKYFFSLSIFGKLIAKKLTALSLNNAIFYSYWMKHGAYALSILQSNATKFARGHGTDIYELKYCHPFHTHIGNTINQILSVSEFGNKYMQSRYNIPSSKITTSFLGTKRLFPLYNGQKNNKEIRLVSCSSCIPIKRVDVIIEACFHVALHFQDKHIRYVHFGSGKEYENLIQLKNNAPENLTIDLKGHVQNHDIQQFYSKNLIHCFINSSISEGIPVSIMEALSYGIPVVAPNVGGVSEIVDKKVGILTEKNIDSTKLAIDIVKIVEGFDKQYLPQNCEKYWKTNFSANTNYTKLANLLLYQGKSM